MPPDAARAAHAADDRHPAQVHPANPPTDYTQQLFAYLQAWRQYLEQAIGAAPGTPRTQPTGSQPRRHSHRAQPTGSPARRRARSHQARSPVRTGSHSSQSARKFVDADPETLGTHRDTTCGSDFQQSCSADPGPTPSVDPSVPHIAAKAAPVGSGRINSSRAAIALLSGRAADAHRSGARPRPARADGSRSPPRRTPGDVEMVGGR